MKLFVNRGRRSGIGEDDLRWALNEGAVILDDAIEAIHSGAVPCSELDAEHAERAVERLDGTKLKAASCAWSWRAANASSAPAYWLALAQRQVGPRSRRVPRAGVGASP